jgi:hypothetical protein
MRGNSAKEPGGPQFAVEWFGIAGAALARVGRNRVWQFYRTWLWLAAFVILFLSVLVFQRVYASVSNDFPNGYPTEHEPFTPGGLRDKDGRVLRVPGK